MIMNYKRREGRLVWFARRRSPCRKMQDEHELIFNTHKQKLLLHKRKLENEISSVNAKSNKKSKFVELQREKETKFGMVFDEMVKIHILLLE